MHRGKLYTSQLATIDRESLYTLEEAIAKIKAMPHAKFDESVEVAMKLGVDPRQSDQALRGAMALPHGTGKSVRIVVAAEGDAATAARAAGADVVGMDDLIAKISEGWLEFDVMIATPSAMREVRKLGRALGPRGLMPNPKTGTVTDDPAAAVREAKAGRIEYRTDRGGCVHVPVGKVSFSELALQENTTAVVNTIIRSRPSSAKGVFLQSCTMSATMSPGVRIDPRHFTRST